MKSGMMVDGRMFHSPQLLTLNPQRADKNEKYDCGVLNGTMQ